MPRALPSPSPIDAVPPVGPWFLLAIQHVLVMYAGAVAVPLIVAGALHLSRADTAFLVSADLFCCGLATLVQSLGIGGFGIRLPVVMAATFACVGPMIAIGGNPALGLPYVFGANIAAGAIGILVAPLIGRLLRLFPPVVTGTVITVIGLTLVGKTGVRVQFLYNAPVRSTSMWSHAAGDTQVGKAGGDACNRQVIRPTVSGRQPRSVT